MLGALGPVGGRVREVRPSPWEAEVGVRNSSMEAADRLCWVVRSEGQEARQGFPARL